MNILIVKTYLYNNFEQDHKIECTQLILRSINHDLYMQSVTEKSLSPFDDKRKYQNSFISGPWVYLS